MFWLVFDGVELEFELSNVNAEMTQETLIDILGLKRDRKNKIVLNGVKDSHHMRTIVPENVMSIYGDVLPTTSSDPKLYALREFNRKFTGNRVKRISTDIQMMDNASKLISTPGTYQYDFRNPKTSSISGIQRPVR